MTTSNTAGSESVSNINFYTLTDGKLKEGIAVEKRDGACWLKDSGVKTSDVGFFSRLAKRVKAGTWENGAFTLGKGDSTAIVAVRAHLHRVRIGGTPVEKTDAIIVDAEKVCVIKLTPGMQMSLDFPKGEGKTLTFTWNGSQLVVSDAVLEASMLTDLRQVIKERKLMRSAARPIRREVTRHGRKVAVLKTRVEKKAEKIKAAPETVWQGAWVAATRTGPATAEKMMTDFPGFESCSFSILSQYADKRATASIWPFKNEALAKAVKAEAERIQKVGADARDCAEARAEAAYSKITLETAFAQTAAVTAQLRKSTAELRKSTEALQSARAAADLQADYLKARDEEVADMTAAFEKVRAQRVEARTELEALKATLNVSSNASVEAAAPKTARKTKGKKARKKDAHHAPAPEAT